MPFKDCKEIITFVVIKNLKELMKSIYLINKWTALSLSLCLLTGCHSNKNKQKTVLAVKKNLQIDTLLQHRLKDFVKAPRMKGNFGIYVYDLTAGKPVYGYDENLDQSSASCLKLISGTAALKLLGTQYRFVDYLCMRGNIDQGILNGDVTLMTGFDPLLTDKDFPKFIQTLKKKNIKKIRGKFILKLMMKDPVKSEQHWYPWDLSFSSYGILFKGAPNMIKAIKVAFRSQGIAIADSQIVLANHVPKGSKCIFWISHPVTGVIKKMWKNSSNTQATSLLYAVGHRVNPHLDPPTAGVNYLRKFLREDLGEKNPRLVIHDGCGLCTHNHLTPKVLNDILRYGYEHKPIYSVMQKKLAIAGIDGTLKGFLAGTPYKGRIKGKTGTLSHPYGISSLAGFCEASNGHLLTFAIMDSKMSVLDAHVLQHKLFNVLVENKKK